uniref:(northern house mosquito) hypothetical protein n=1 Tax=Culex pipiens TaxID=7175 RepID=A0A8D8FZA8_CULPI
MPAMAPHQRPVPAMASEAFRASTRPPSAARATLNSSWRMPRTTVEGRWLFFRCGEPGGNRKLTREEFPPPPPLGEYCSASLGFAAAAAAAAFCLAAAFLSALLFLAASFFEHLPDVVQLVESPGLVSLLLVLSLVTPVVVRLCNVVSVLSPSVVLPTSLQQSPSVPVAEVGVCGVA